VRREGKERDENKTRETSMCKTRNIKEQWGLNNRTSQKHGQDKPDSRDLNNFRKGGFLHNFPQENQSGSRKLELAYRNMIDS
jgi:hypothetical protein